MKETKVYTKPAYKCGICGKEFSSVQERMNCEMTCIAKQKEEEKKAAEAKKRAEKDARQHEIDAALDNAFALINKYIEDYGSFTYNGNYKGLDLLNMDLFPTKLFHHFWF